MELTPTDVDLLLGAWALGTLEPELTDAVERALATDAALASTAAGLKRAAQALDSSIAAAPDDLLADVLATAREHAPALVSPSDPLSLFANQVGTLRAVAAELTEDEYGAPALPYDWTIHGLLAHLLVIERYTAGQLGLLAPHPDATAGHLELGAAEIESELRRPGAATAEEWHRRAASTADALAGGNGPALDDAVRFHQWPLSTASLLIARAFEIWTHTDDIRRATGRPVAAPGASDLRAMSQFSVNSLPLVLPLVAPDTALGGARVVLTGDGGGTIDLGDPERRDVLIAADVVDYCHLAARRIDLDELDATFEGDEAVGRDLLSAARVFAV